MIANDDADNLRELRDTESLPFPILLDEDAETIKNWGLLNETTSRGRVIPHPTVAILDSAGVVRYFLTETNYRLRPPSADLVERLRALPASESPSPEAR